jgi:hypothetical protein
MRESRGKERAGRAGNSFYSHTTQIQVRLHFLAVIFSNCLSPDSFRYMCLVSTTVARSGYLSPDPDPDPILN